MRVLVTGAAGFIGSHLTDRLLARGDSVVGLDSFDPFYSREAKERNVRAAADHPRFDLVEGDIRDAEALAGLPTDIDAIVHLAALAGVRPSLENPQAYFDVNLGGSVQLLEFARTRGIRPFVFASSSSVYGVNPKVPFSESDSVDHPISPYAASKKAGELAAHAYHHLFQIDVMCLRFFTVYGPRQRPDLAIHKFARLMARGEAIPVFGDGSSERDYTFVDDIVDGTEAALDYLVGNRGVYEVVNLGESETISLARMIRTVSDTMGVNPTIDRKGDQPGDVPRTFADIGKAKSLLGYDPSTGFDEGVQRFFEWFERVHQGGP